MRVRIRLGEKRNEMKCQKNNLFFSVKKIVFLIIKIILIAFEYDFNVTEYFCLGKGWGIRSPQSL